MVSVPCAIVRRVYDSREANAPLPARVNRDRRFCMVTPYVPDCCKSNGSPDGVRLDDVGVWFLERTYGTAGTRRGWIPSLPPPDVSQNLAPTIFRSPRTFA